MTADAGVLPTRRERKKQATREAIHSAAVALVEERGLAGVTIEAITERADVAPRTFFNYFSSKEEAVLGRSPDEADTRRRRLEELLTTLPPFDALAETFREDILSRLTTSEDFLREHRLIITEPGLAPAAFAQWEKLERALVAAVAAHSGADPEHDLYPSVLVVALLGASRLCIWRWAGGDARPLAQLFDEAVDQLASGLRKQGTAGHPHPGSRKR